jgi:hypothetical protein
MATNTQHLRDIINGFAKTYDIDISEAEEFLQEIEGQIFDLHDSFRVSEAEAGELRMKIEEMEEGSEWRNRSFVGLDTIRWQLERGNLKVQMQMEEFIKNLQIKNSATVS